MGLAVVQAPPNLLPDRRLMISHALLFPQLALTNTNHRQVCDLCLFWWVWFCSLLLGPSQFVIALRLIMSGDVELNPGPLDQGQWLNSGWLESGTHFFIFIVFLQKIKKFSLELTAQLLVRICM